MTATYLEKLITSLIAVLPTSQQVKLSRLNTHVPEQQTQSVIGYCRNGWPVKTDLNEVVKPYWKARGELTEQQQPLIV